MNKNEMTTAVVAIIGVLLLSIVIAVGVVEYQGIMSNERVERIKACADSPTVNDQIICVKGTR